MSLLTVLTEMYNWAGGEKYHQGDHIHFQVIEEWLCEFFR